MCESFVAFGCLGPPAIIEKVLHPFNKWLVHSYNSPEKCNCIILHICIQTGKQGEVKHYAKDHAGNGKIRKTI